MNYSITDTKLKNFIKKQFNLDLTGKIEMIDSAFEIPREFYDYTSPVSVNKSLNSFGPMYLVNHNGNHYLIQEIGKTFRIINSKSGYVNEFDFFNELGIPPFISIMDLINTYYKEDEHL